jgi:hypothetical protein
MSEMKSMNEGRLSIGESGSWGDRYNPTERNGTSGVSRGWLIVGMAALAVGGIAWYHFGSDFRRYLKIKSM